MTKPLHPLKQLRASQKLTQSDLGMILNMSGNHIAQLENGTLKPTQGLVSEVSKTFALDTVKFNKAVEKHRIEYLKPAFANEAVVALSWVADFRRVRSLRRYRFLRKSDDMLLARGETDWVFVDAETGRPRTIPEAVSRVFPLVTKDEEPG